MSKNSEGSLNLKFLGDALDHWKGSLFESLQAARILQGFAVDPMASDLRSWTPRDFEIFARLLRIDPAQVIRHQATLVERAKYFDEISHRGDLFLDPDTGVATGRVKNAGCYVRAAELGRLLDAFPERLLAVYQHVRGKPVADRIDDVASAVRKEAGNFSWCSYESSTVGMIFLSRTASRTGQVAEHFQSLLALHATGRIRLKS